MYKEQEGPIETIIPETKILSCGRCKYHLHSMVKSGMNPIYKDNCNHPDLEQNLSFLQGNLNKHFLHNIVETPNWCPFLKKDK